MSIRVECDSGYRGELEPSAFWLGERRLAVRALTDRWYAPQLRWFKSRPMMEACTSCGMMSQAEIEIAAYRRDA